MNGLDILEREGNQVLWRYNGADGSSYVGPDGVAKDALIDDPDLLLTLYAAQGIRDAVTAWRAKPMTRIIPNLDVLEREGDEVHWRYGFNDGTSLIRDGEVRGSELLEQGILLTSDTRAKINRAINEWMRDSGEGDVWWSEQ